MKLRTKTAQVYKEFEKDGVDVVVNSYEFHGKELRYVVSGSGTDDSKPVILFVHGAPGSSDNYYHFMKDSTLMSEATMIAVDRLGYGFSDFGESEPSITEQSNSLEPLLNLYKGRRIVLVGHSYGGPIIARYAMDHQEIDGLLLLAPAIDPDNEKIFFVSHLGRLYPTRWITPTSLKVATDEKFQHAKELETMLPLWDNIQSKVVYIHGSEDGIVPYQNLQFASEHLVNAPLDTITLVGGNHFIPWNQEGLVKEKLLELIH